MAEIKPTNTVLKALFESPVIIGPTDGKETIGDAKEVFAGYLDPEYHRRGKSEGDGPTKATPVMVYEIQQDTTLKQVFLSSFATRLKNLCLTQSQIVEFCRTNRDKITDDRSATYFLFLGGLDRLLIADVFMNELSELETHVIVLERDGTCRGQDRFRVIVPQFEM